MGKIKLMKWIMLACCWACIFFMAFSHDRIVVAIYHIGAYICLGFTVILIKLSKNDTPS